MVSILLILPTLTDSFVESKEHNIINNIITYQYKLKIDKNYDINVSNSILGSAIIEVKPESYIGNGWCTDLVRYYRKVPWHGNAIDWWQNAIDNKYNVGQEPKINAIMIEKTDYIYGHVALVIDVDEENKTFTVLEQNMNGRGIVSQRILSFNHPVIGFIY